MLCLQSNHIQSLQAASAKFLWLFCRFQFAIFLILACRVVATGLPGAGSTTIFKFNQFSPNKVLRLQLTQQYSTITLPKTSIPPENRPKPKKETSSFPNSNPFFTGRKCEFQGGYCATSSPKTLESCLGGGEVDGTNRRPSNGRPLKCKLSGEETWVKLCFNYIHLCEKQCPKTTHVHFTVPSMAQGPFWDGNYLS